MQQITPAEKEQFESLGYVVIPMNVSSGLISKALTGGRNMKFRAINENYPLTRTYYDHLSCWNIAAIEAPFNKRILDSRVKALLEQLNLGATVCSLMGWDATYCSLARLFTMGEYKYRGNWHRDDALKTKKSAPETPWKCSNIVQVGLYLEEQHGFRFLKKDYDIYGEKSIIKNLEDNELIQSYHFPLLPPRESFDILGGDAGTILFFNPNRMHQGSTDGSRVDFHMRFENFSGAKIPHNQLIQNSFLDFKCVPELGEILAPLEIASNGALPRTLKRSIKKRLINSINYRTGLNNFRRIIALKASQKNAPPHWAPDLFSNTIFQT
jgi:hypothetical protein